MSHVAIGYGGAVLSASLLGRWFFPSIDYCCRAPGLRGAFIVPVPWPPAMSSFEQWPRRRMSMVRIFLRWLSGGRIRSDSNVEVVAAALRTAGLAAPSNFVTPTDLFEWLVDRGYAWEPLYGPPLTLEAVAAAVAAEEVY